MDATTLTVTAGAALVGFLTAALLGKVLIPVLHRLKFGQTIREEGPAWHRAKQGTPTMGGVLFIIGSLAAALLATIPVIVLFMCIEKHLAEGLTSGGVKG